MKLVIAVVLMGVVCLPQKGAEDCVASDNSRALMRGAYQCGKLALARETAAVLARPSVKADVEKAYAAGYCADIERLMAK